MDVERRVGFRGKQGARIQSVRYIDSDTHSEITGVMETLQIQVYGYYEE